mmetsp:Transcript_59226/g.176014  ORF Transcript_59226/g.176014 Transcript_59226/m.176014 type:complete len:193 (-) Transcript_59226:29-607(-)
MPFELKPQIQINILTKSVDEIVWTHPRSPVPPVLAGRISKATWARTFDAVRGQYDEYLSAIKGIRPIIFIPCLVPCSMPKMMKISQDWQDNWLALVQSQAEIYTPLGVQVTLAKELHCMGSGSSRNIRNEIVGLSFELGPEVQAQQHIYAPSGQIRPGDDLVSKLSKLNELHKAGAISGKEYEVAKAKILTG